MDKETIISSAVDFTRESSLNFVSEEAAISPKYIGLKMFEAPIFAFGKADDDIYVRFKSPEVIGEHHMAPDEWLTGAKTVISFFLPYSDRIKTANSTDIKWPADEWLHGRIEGQKFVRSLTIHIAKMLQDAGFDSLAPSLDKRFRSGTDENKHTSNWSERHAAFACGLGTFGLSKGLITEKGLCGRFGSVLTKLDLPADGRPYSDVYEYCIMCGLCIAQCPVHDISFERGKDFKPCAEFLDIVLQKHKPRYGCGKCQVSVPCESGRP